MLALLKLITLGIFSCVTGYVIWINNQDYKGSSQLANINGISNIEQKSHADPNPLGLEKLTSLIGEMQKQLNVQQTELKKQQIAINTLVTTINEKESLYTTQITQSEDSDWETLDLEPDNEYITEQIEMLDSTFANQVVDEQWSNTAIDNASEVLDKVIPAGVNITQLDCKSTFCKIDVDHENGADIENYLEKFMFELGWETSSYIQSIDNQDGSKTTQVYLSRDGYSLPEL